MPRNLAPLLAVAVFIAGCLAFAAPGDLSGRQTVSSVEIADTDSNFVPVSAIVDGFGAIAGSPTTPWRTMSASGGDHFAWLLTGPSDATNAAVDGSSTVVRFERGPGSGQVLDLRAITVTIRDTGAYTAETFGALAALTNGVRLCVTETITPVDTDTDDTVPADPAYQDCESGGDLLPAIKRLADLSAVSASCGGDAVCGGGGGGGSGANAATYRIELDRLFGGSIPIGAGQTIQAVIRDNLTGLTAFDLVAYGTIR